MAVMAMRMQYKIRNLRFEDGTDLIEDYYSYYNEIDGGNVTLGLGLFKKKPGMESEIGWFADTYKSVLGGNKIVKVAVVGDKVVGMCEVTTVRPGSENDHIGTLGIAIREGYRDNGIGTALIKEALKDSKKRFEGVRLNAFTVNKRAIAVYKKMGFVKCGKLPKVVKRSGRYFDEYVMYLDLQKAKL